MATMHTQRRIERHQLAVGRPENRGHQATQQSLRARERPSLFVSHLQHPKARDAVGPLAGKGQLPAVGRQGKRRCFSELDAWRDLRADGRERRHWCARRDEHDTGTRQGADRKRDGGHRAASLQDVVIRPGRRQEFRHREYGGDGRWLAPRSGVLN